MFSPKDPAGALDIFNHDALFERSLKGLRNRPRDGVHSASSSCDHEFDRAAAILRIVTFSGLRRKAQASGPACRQAT